MSISSCLQYLHFLTTFSHVTILCYKSANITMAGASFGVLVLERFEKQCINLQIGQTEHVKTWGQVRPEIATTYWEIKWSVKSKWKSKCGEWESKWVNEWVGRRFKRNAEKRRDTESENGFGVAWNYTSLHFPWFPSQSFEMVISLLIFA